MKWLKGFTLFAFYINVLSAGTQIGSLIVNPNIISALLLVVNVFFVVLMYKQYKGLVNEAV